MQTSHFSSVSRPKYGEIGLVLFYKDRAKYGGKSQFI
jgi:hypothetical protein